VIIRIVLADDQELLRATFRLLLDSEPDLEVVAEAGTGAEAVARARDSRADLVVMDIRMPDMDGIEATRLTGFSDVAAALEAADASPMARMHAYLDFAAAHPRVYEAMFSLPRGWPSRPTTPPDRSGVPSRASATHSLMPTAPGRKSPGRRCTAWPPSRPADACARTTSRPGSTSPAACSPSRRPADRPYATW
jgi:Response regulator receiver domain